MAQASPKCDTMFRYNVSVVLWCGPNHEGFLFLYLFGSFDSLLHCLSGSEVGLRVVSIPVVPDHLECEHLKQILFWNQKTFQ